MDNTISQPPHRRARLFLFFTLCAAAGIFIWFFFFNKNSPPPPASPAFVPFLKAVEAEPPAAEKVASIASFSIRLENQKSLLVKKNVDGSEEKIAFFERVLTAPSVSASPTGRHLLIKDTTAEVETYYVIGVEKKTRRRLEGDASLASVSWRGEWLVVEEKATTSKAYEIALINTETFQKKTLPAIRATTIVEEQPGVFIFISTKDASAHAGKAGASFSDVLENIDEEGNFLSGALSVQRFLSAYDATKDTFETYIEIPRTADEEVEEVRVHEGEIFLKKGGTWLVFVRAPSAE